MKTKIFSTILVSIFLALFTIGCGSIVQVPPAHKGKVLTESGYSADLKEPSSFRLPYSWSYDPKLVLVEVSDQQVKESQELFMPKDQLMLSFDLRLNMAISTEPSDIENIFQRISPVPDPMIDDDDVLSIPFLAVYEAYAQQIVRTVPRQILAKYDIMQVLSSREAIGVEMLAALQTELKSAPIKVTRVDLAETKPPDVIVAAQESAKKREVAINEAEADKLVKLTEAEAALAVAKKQQQVDLINAETQVLVNKKMAEGVSQAWVTQKALTILESLASPANSNKVFVLPYEALKNPALMMGVNNNALNNDSSGN